MDGRVGEGRRFETGVQLMSHMVQRSKKKIFNLMSKGIVV